MKKSSTLLLLLFFISSCASLAQQRSLKDLPGSDFTIEIPAGWWKPARINQFLITRDGAFKQYVLIQKRPLARPFRHTKKTIKQGMLPQEAAGIIIDEIASDRNILNFKVLQNAPAVIEGNAGFKIVFTYGGKNGSSYKTLYYGFIHGSSFYSLRYNARRQSFYAKDLEAFEAMVKSFRLLNR
jgi:hypothetical protein